MSGTDLLHTGTLLLVNREHPLIQEPAGDSLVNVGPQVLLRARAGEMLLRLLRAVGGVNSIVPVSGCRSREEQQRIWDGSLAEHGQKFTETYVALPGCSEHQTGLAIDLGENVPDIDFLCPSFPEDGVCGAFRQKAADFGFVLRYPKGKESITGIGHEPWHFRYVGCPHAQIMTERGWVLEEYIAALHGFSEEGEHLHFQAAGEPCELYWVPSGRSEGLEQRLSAGVPFRCDGDNAGGVVVTLGRGAG